MEGMRLHNSGQQEDSTRAAEVIALSVEIAKLDRRVLFVQPLRLCTAISLTAWVIALFTGLPFDHSAVNITLGLFVTDSFVQFVCDGCERRRYRACEKLDELRERIEDEFRKPQRRLEAESGKRMEVVKGLQEMEASQDGRVDLLKLRETRRDLEALEIAEREAWKLAMRGQILLALKGVEEQGKLWRKETLLEALEELEKTGEMEDEGEVYEVLVEQELERLKE